MAANERFFGHDLRVTTTRDTVGFGIDGRLATLSSKDTYDLARFLDEWGTGWVQAQSLVASRVFVLRLNYVILGVHSTGERAEHEASCLMQALGGSWFVVRGERSWRDATGRWLEIDAHDVR